MLFVVSLHSCFQRSERAVDLLVYRNVDFSRGRPKHNDTAAVVCCLEVADVFANLLHHIPTVSASFHVVTVKTFCIIMVESRLHRNDFNQFALNRLYVFFFKHLSVDSRLVCVCRINVPRTENDVVQICQRHDVFIVKIFLFSTAANADFVVLCH